MRSARPASDDSLGPNAIIRRPPEDSSFGGWRPRRRIAATATSEVFLLENSQGCRAVGKRLLPPLGSLGSGLIDNEYVALRRFADPAVVRVLDLAQHESESWLLLEHLRYGDLRSLAGASPARWLPLLLPPVRWLAGLHAAGFIYGDVKTSHLMLRHPSHACFIDLATVTRRGRPLVTQTAAASPPEGVADAGPTTDVFAFGVMLHELLFARLPGGSGEWTNANLHACPQLVNLSVACRLPSPTDRPTMATVLRQLGELTERMNAAGAALP